MVILFKWSFIVVIVIFLSACGGGGGGGSSYGGNSVGPRNSNNNNGANPGNNGYTETYTNRYGDTVAPSNVKPDVFEARGPGGYVSITIFRHIDLKSGEAVKILTHYSADNDYITYNVNEALSIDLECKDYGFRQSDLGSSQTLNGIVRKVYYTDTARCTEVDYESIPDNVNIKLSGNYTVVTSDIQYPH